MLFSDSNKIIMFLSSQGMGCWWYHSSFTGRSLVAKGEWESIWAHWLPGWSWSIATWVMSWFEWEWPPQTHRKWHYQEVWLCWSGCGLIGGSVSLGVRFEVSDAQGRPSVTFSFPAALGSRYRTLLLPQHHDCLHAAMSHHDNNGLKLWTISQSQRNVFLC